jgi:hypothetical protein
MSEARSKRASKRIDVLYDAVVMTSAGQEIPAVVKDLSADGFRIEIDEELHVGEHVMLRRPSERDVPARIVWTLGLEAGGTFLAKHGIK